jgi:hypothetical protein
MRLTDQLRNLTALTLLAMASVAAAASLHQAAFDARSETYVLGYSSMDEIRIVGAPRDTDWSRTAMLHDGTTYRLYAFKAASRNTLYQFAFDPSRSAYVYGYSSIPEIEVDGMPRDADAGSFAMLHDGDVYRLYIPRRGDPSTLYQFGFDPRSEAYEFGYRSEEVIRIQGMPRDTDWDRWAMLHDGSTYRFYAMRRGTDLLYQAAWDDSRVAYVFGYNSLAEIPVDRMPGADVAMLHDGDDFRLYTVDR